MQDGRDDSINMGSLDTMSDPLQWTLGYATTVQPGAGAGAGTGAHLDLTARPSAPPEPIITYPPLTPLLPSHPTTALSLPTMVAVDPFAYPTAAPTTGGGTGVGLGVRSDSAPSTLDLPPIHLPLGPDSATQLVQDLVALTSKPTVNPLATIREFGTSDSGDLSTESAYRVVRQYYATQFQTSPKLQGFNQVRGTALPLQSTYRLPLLAWVVNWFVLSRDAKLVAQRSHRSPKKMQKSWKASALRGATDRDDDHALFKTITMHKKYQAGQTVGFAVRELTKHRERASNILNSLGSGVKELGDLVTGRMGDPTQQMQAAVAHLSHVFALAILEALKLGDDTTIYRILRETQIISNAEGWDSGQVSIAGTTNLLNSAMTMTLICFLNTDYRLQSTLSHFVQHAGALNAKIPLITQCALEHLLGALLIGAQTNRQNQRIPAHFVLLDLAGLSRPTLTQRCAYPLDILDTEGRTALQAWFSRPLIVDDAHSAHPEDVPKPFVHSTDDWLWISHKLLHNCAHPQHATPDHLYPTAMHALIRCAIDDDQRARAGIERGQTKLGPTDGSAGYHQALKRQGILNTARKTYTAALDQEVASPLFIEYVCWVTTRLLMDAEHSLLIAAIDYTHGRSTADLFKQAIVPIVKQLEAGRAGLASCATPDYLLTSDQIYFHQVQDQDTHKLSGAIDALNALSETLNSTTQPPKSVPSGETEAQPHTSDRSIAVYPTIYVLRETRTLYQNFKTTRANMQLGSTCRALLSNENKHLWDDLDTAAAQKAFADAAWSPSGSVVGVKGFIAQDERLERSMLTRLLTRIHRQLRIKGNTQAGHIELITTQANPDSTAPVHIDHITTLMADICHRTGDQALTTRQTNMPALAQLQQTHLYEQYAKTRRALDQLQARKVHTEAVRKRLFKTLVAQEARSPRQSLCQTDEGKRPTPLALLLASGRADWLSPKTFSPLLEYAQRTLCLSLQSTRFKGGLSKTHPTPLELLIACLPGVPTYHLDPADYGVCAVVQHPKPNLKHIAAMVNWLIENQTHPEAACPGSPSPLHVVLMLCTHHDDYSRTLGRTLFASMLGQYHKFSTKWDGDLNWSAKHTQDLLEHLGALHISASSRTPPSLGPALGIHAQGEHCSLLMQAISQDTPSEAILLLAQPNIQFGSAKDQPDPTTLNGQGPLHLLVTCAHSRAHPNLNASRDSSLTRDIDHLLTRLLERGADPVQLITAGRFTGETPIYAAAKVGDHRLLEALLQRAVSMTGTDEHQKAELARDLVQAPESGKPPHQSPLAAAMRCTINDSAQTDEHGHQSTYIAVNMLLQTVSTLCAEDPIKIAVAFKGDAADGMWPGLLALCDQYRLPAVPTTQPHGVNELVEAVLKTDLAVLNVLCQFSQMFDLETWPLTHLPDTISQSLTRLHLDELRCSPAMHPATPWPQRPPILQNLTQVEAAIITVLTIALDPRQGDLERALAIAQLSINMVGGHPDESDNRLHALVKWTLCHPLVLAAVAQKSGSDQPSLDDALVVVRAVPTALMDMVINRLIKPHAPGQSLESAFNPQSLQPHNPVDVIYREPGVEAVHGLTPIALILMAKRPELLELALPALYSLQYAAAVQDTLAKDQLRIDHQHAQAQSRGWLAKRLFGQMRQTEQHVPDWQKPFADLLETIGGAGYLWFCLVDGDPRASAGAVQMISPDQGERARQAMMADMLYHHQKTHRLADQSYHPFTQINEGGLSNKDPKDWAKHKCYIRDLDGRWKLMRLARAAWRMRTTDASGEPILHAEFNQVLQRNTPGLDAHWQLMEAAREGDHDGLQLPMINPSFEVAPAERISLLRAIAMDAGYAIMGDAQRETLRLLLQGAVSDIHKTTRCALADITQGTTLNPCDTAFHLAVNYGHLSFITAAFQQLQELSTRTWLQQRTRYIQLLPATSADKKSIFVHFQTASQYALMRLTTVVNSAPNMALQDQNSTIEVPMTLWDQYIWLVTTSVSRAALFKRMAQTTWATYQRTNYQAWLTQHNDAKESIHDLQTRPSLLRRLTVPIPQASMKFTPDNLIPADELQSKKASFERRQEIFRQHAQEMDQDTTRISAQRKDFESQMQVLSALRVNATTVFWPRQAIRKLECGFGDLYTLHLIAGYGDIALLNTTLNLAGISETTAPTELQMILAAAIDTKGPPQYAELRSNVPANRTSCLTLVNGATPLHMLLYRAQHPSGLLYRLAKLCGPSILEHMDAHGLSPVALAALRDIFCPATDEHGQPISCLADLTRDREHGQYATTIDHLATPIDSLHGLTPLHLACLAKNCDAVERIAGLLSVKGRLATVLNIQSTNTQDTDLNLDYILLKPDELKHLPTMRLNLHVTQKATPLRCALAHDEKNLSILTLTALLSANTSPWIAPKLARGLIRRQKGWRTEYPIFTGLGVVALIVIGVVSLQLDFYRHVAPPFFSIAGASIFFALSALLFVHAAAQLRVNQLLNRIIPQESIAFIRPKQLAHPPSASRPVATHIHPVARRAGGGTIHLTTASRKPR